MRLLDSVTEATNMNLTQLREAVEDRRAWRALVHGITELDTTKGLNKNSKRSHTPLLNKLFQVFHDFALEYTI